MLLWHNCLDNVITPIYLDHLAHLILSGTCHNLGWSCVIKSCHHLKNCHHLGWRRHHLGCDRDEKLYTVSHHLGRSPPSPPPGVISRENRFRTVRRRRKDMVVRLGWDAAMPSKMSTDQHLPSCGFSTTCDLAGDIFVERTELWPYLVSPDKYPGTACNIQAGDPAQWISNHSMNLAHSIAAMNAFFDVFVCISVLLCMLRTILCSGLSTYKSRLRPFISNY